MQNDETPAAVILPGLGESAKEGGACDTLLGSLGRQEGAVSAVKSSGPAGVHRVEHRDGPQGADQRDGHGILSPFMAEGSPIIGQQVQMTHFDIFRDEIRIVISDGLNNVNCKLSEKYRVYFSKKVMGNFSKYDILEIKEAEGSYQDGSLVINLVTRPLPGRQELIGEPVPLSLCPTIRRPKNETNPPLLDHYDEFFSQDQSVIDGAKKVYSKTKLAELTVSAEQLSTRVMSENVLCEGKAMSADAMKYFCGISEIKEVSYYSQFVEISVLASDNLSEYSVKIEWKKLDTKKKQTWADRFVFTCDCIGFKAQRKTRQTTGNYCKHIVFVVMFLFLN